MKDYQQQTQSILRKVNAKKRRKRAVALGACALGAAAFALVLFLPYPTPTNSIAVYQASEYYPVIEKLNDIVQTEWNEAPRYKNNFEKWTASLFGGGAKFGALGAAPPTAPGDTTTDTWDEAVGDSSYEAATPEGTAPGTNTDDRYEETTDNQVQGVIEADLLKRTTTHAFYLTSAYNTAWSEEGYYKSYNGALLRVYSINGASSTQVDSIVIEMAEGMKSYSASEMYLSKDCTTLTVFSTVYISNESKTYTEVVSLDVSDPANVAESSRIYLSGAYLSSRMVDGEFLVMSSYVVNRNSLDFGDESTYLPQNGTLDNMQNVPAENVVCPDVATSARYTVVTKLDGETLEVEDSVALLSYTEEAYVSATNLFLTQSYVRKIGLENGDTEQHSRTEITCVSYTGEGLEVKGTTSVDGTVKDQYSMDEYDGVLRVVTTGRKSILREQTGYGGYIWNSTVASETTANLYCIGLTDFEIVAKVEKFAPEGETVESVRFNGDKAYVCTAVVITLTDPVFFFDLSDLSNITWTDTGVIDGYSSNLIDYGHGYLVGVGMDGNGDLKIEVYTQGEGKVDSVDSYTLSASFSTTYKSYLIDKEQGLIGLGVSAYIPEEGQYVRGYLLLKIEDGKLTTQYLIPHHGAMSDMRAFYEDGYLYLFGDKFQAVQIEE